ncbi:MAG: tripartite tricarboxylate transporter permease [Thermodesulfobacteriota bacterium]|nr:tripartite tricarboxylate transporter permease [Thermodesulfobacteriota bacterium]
MELLNYLGIGFSVALQPVNLFYCFVGVFIGTLVGVLPGIGPVGAMSLLLPTTFKATPEAAIIMLAGIYYGAMYGGSTTSILVNIPGEAASVVTCLDGYQMAQQGRAGPALGIAAFGSFIAGTLSILGLMLLAPPLSKFALRFGPPEYFTLMVLGLTILIYLAHGSMSKALVMAAFGIILGLVGLDSINARPRFTFGKMELIDGVGLVPVVMGLFGVSEVLLNIEQVVRRNVLKTRVKGLLPTVKDWRDSTGPIARGSLLGFFLGILPGGGAVISSFISYAVEKRISKHPERFGTGAIEGVAGPESANNAATGGAFIPLMTLGIPPNVIMAMLLGAFMIHGVTPGPLMMKQNPGIFWGVIVSMYIGNIMLLILNLPLITIWVQVLKVPYKILFPLILLFCLIGVYSVNNVVFDIYIMLIFGIMGYLMKKFGYEGAPLVLAFVLGPLMENNLRKSLIISQGDFSIFFVRPLAAASLILALFLLISPLIPGLGKKRKVIPKEEVL